MQKIQRTTISALSLATITYPDGLNRAVWLLDGNVPYLQGKHIPLFIAGVATVMFLSIPYSLLLLFTQCLQRMSGYMLLKWVAKTKPFFDAYFGPCKEKETLLDWACTLLSERSFSCIFIQHSRRSCTQSACDLLPGCYLTSSCLTKLILPCMLLETRLC